MNTLEEILSNKNNVLNFSRNGDGDKYQCLDGEYHCDNGPAIEYANGDKKWYKNGKLHREDGPAIEFSDGHKEWWLNGKRHREDGPAIEYANGTKCWYKDNKRHRDDGPAVEYAYANGYKCWYIHLGTDSRKYDFYQYRENNSKCWRIKAGCRDFTIIQAKKHWKNNLEVLEILKNIKL